MTPAPPSVALLSALSYRHGSVLALDVIDLAIPAARMVGFIGPDGVGKSSLLALLSGTRKIQSGSVEVLAAIFANQSIALGDYGHFLLWTTLGNAIGGVVFVALIKYSHVFYASPEHDDISLADEVAAD